VLILLLVHLAAALVATLIALMVLRGPLRTFLASRAAGSALDPGARRLLFGALAGVGVTSGAFLGGAGGMLDLLSGSDPAGAAAFEAVRAALGAWRGLAFALLFLLGIGFLTPAAEGPRPLVRANPGGGADRGIDRGRAEPQRLPLASRSREGPAPAPRPIRGGERGGEPRRNPIAGGGSSGSSGSGGSGGRSGGPGRERREGREGRDREGGRSGREGREGREGRDWQGRDRHRDRDRERESPDREREEPEGKPRGSLVQDWAPRETRPPMGNGSLPATRHRGAQGPHGARPLPGDAPRTPVRAALSAPEAVEKTDA
jgi:uncharacterized membrane protein YgcG